MSTRRALAALALALAVAGASCGPKKDPTAPDSAKGGLAGAGGSGGGAVDAGPGSANAEEAKMNASALGHYRRGLELWRSGDVAGAKKAFRDATAADPQAYQAFHALGTVQERTGEPDAALNSYRQASSVSPNYEPAIAAYGILLARRGNVTEADDYLTDKKARMPRAALVLAALSEVKSIKRDTGTAQQLAQDALKINPDCRPAMITLARDHYRNRRLDLSLYALKAILDGEGQNNPPRDKDNAEGHLLRAVILKELGRRAPAIDEFQKAVALRPDLVDARVQLAAYLLESGNAQEALPHLEASLRYDPNHLLAHLNLGDAYRLLGRAADAKREFDYVTSRDSSLPQAQYSLGLLYLFSPSMPGMDAKAQVSAAISAFERYQQLRGKPQAGSSDDSDQLLLRAKAKQGELNAGSQPAAAGSGAPAGSAPPPAAPAAPAASAAPAKKK